MADIQNLNPLGRLVDALDPWLDQVVIVGGWAHQLYRLHPHAQQLDYRPLTTLDTDIALPAKLPVGVEDIRERLRARGFTEEFLGRDHPPATHYHLGGEESGFYAEFLTPLMVVIDRHHKRKATMEISGINSQQLRYIELLLQSPWSVEFASSRYKGKIQIANPVSFLVQKVLIHDKREDADRAKDILYMRDTLEVFGERLPELKELWRTTVLPSLGSRAASTASKASHALFSNITDPIRRAAQISSERALHLKKLEWPASLVSIKYLGDLPPRNRSDSSGLWTWSHPRDSSGSVSRRRLPVGLSTL